MAMDDKITPYDCRRCGPFRITDSAKAVLEPLSEQERMRVAIVVRQSAESGAPLDIYSDTVEDLKDREPRKKHLVEQVDDVLLYLANRAPSHWAKVEYNQAWDHTLLGFVGEKQMNDAVIAAGKLELFDAIKSKFTIEGWKRVGELRSKQPDSRKAFVAMWFTEKEGMQTAWEDGFEKGIEDTKYFRAYRVLDDEHTGKVDDLIMAEIRTSGLLVADLTGQRQSVYFEAGFAMGLGIPIIWTCRKDQLDDLHFDIRQYNHIGWENPEELREKLKNRILAVIPAASA